MRRPFALITAAVIAGGLALTPAASPAPLEVGTLHSTGQASLAARIEPPVVDEGQSRSKKIRQTEVCFTVHNPGDPTPQQVIGTLFATEAYSAGGTALFLLHAGFAERSSWDGARPSVKGAASVVRPLAEAGYGVFTVDRLGHGESPYVGPPATLTTTAQVEMAHEMVSHIRAGSFRLKPLDGGTCAHGVPDGRAATNVVLMGYSSGAAISELYATRHHDIDGVVSLMYSSQGFSNAYKEHVLNTIGPQVLAGETDYFYFFEPGPDGYSVACEKLLFDVEGIRDPVLKQICGMHYYADTEARTSPVGEGTVVTAGTEMQASIGLVGPTPALLVFADNDAVVTDADSGGGEPDLVTPEIEMWRDLCNCDVSVLFQENAGHAGWFHDSAPDMTDGILEWLRSRDL